MFKALTKFGFSAGAITGTICASENALAENTDLGAGLQKPKNKLNSVTKIEDIDIFAKQKGCAFAFVADWRNQKVYSAEEFVKLEEEKKKTSPNSTEWAKIAVNVVNQEKSKCKKGKTVAFAYYGGKFSVKPAP